MTPLPVSVRTDSLAERGRFELSLPSSNGWKANLVVPRAQTKFPTRENSFDHIYWRAGAPAISIPSSSEQFGLF